jgi:uncharacterized membrane protein YbhN (UPF0104 family)
MTEATLVLDDAPGNSQSGIRLFLCCAVSAGLLGYLLWQTGWSQFDDAVKVVPLPPLFMAFVALVASVFLAGARLVILARYTGHKVPFASALAAVCLGQIAGLFLFQIFGQLVVRSALLKRSGVPAATSVYLTLYERLTALILLLVFAAAGAFWIFGSIAIDFESGGRDFVAMIIGGLFVLVFTSYWAWGTHFKAAWSTVEKGLPFRLLLNVAVTLGIQFCTLASFVVLALAIAPTIDLERIVAASAIIMFAGAFPISMAGWGIRELSAVFAFGAIGFPNSQALLIGIAIGVLSLLTNLIVGVASAVLPARPHSAASDLTPHDHPMKVLGMVLPILAAMAIFFQIHVPLAGNQTNVNFADPMALLGGGLFLLIFLKDRPQWRLDRLYFFVGLMSTAIVLGFLHGLYTIGWTPWAATRVFGWLVILSYGATGALIVRTAQGDGISIVIRTIVSGAAAIVVFFLVCMVLKAIHIDPFLLPGRVAGFAVDANGFAFQLLVALALLLGCLSHWRWKGVVLMLLTIGVGLTGSRSGSIGFAVMVTVYMIVRRKIEAPTLIRILLVILALVAARLLLGELQRLSSDEVGVFLSQGTSSLAFVDARPGSTNEHAGTVSAGLQLFLQRPLTGNGLGYFMATYWNGSAGAHPIDSTAVSLLAETGILGFAAFLLPFLVLLVTEWRRARSSQDERAISIVMLLIAFSAMGLFYDLLYQRLLWFSFGVLLASELGASACSVNAATEFGPEKTSTPMCN